MSEMYGVRKDLQPKADELFYKRWSPRAFMKHEFTKEELDKILDAGRWAPSCFNEQPWHFILSTPKTFDDFLNLLDPANQTWCKNVSILGFVINKKHFKMTGEENSFAQFDSGSAWVSMALQASTLGYHMHGMGGIHKEEIVKHFKIDTAKWNVICGFALGKREPDVVKLNLPKSLVDMERPNTRKKLEDIYSFGSFDPKI
jgi:nitroreductase